MPTHASASVQPSRISQDAIQLRNVNEERNRQPNLGRNNDDTAQRNEGGQQNGHMTLDGRRRPRNSQRQTATSPENEEWNDWTGNWRRMGNRGQSQAVTMSGTITRGKKKGQVVDVQLDLTNGELMEISTTHDRLNSTTTPDTPDSLPTTGIEPKTSDCGCGVTAGPHILLFSIIAFPFIFIGSLLVSFYFGALTWQNIFSYYYDERTMCHRIFICPLLVLLFPLYIVIFTLGIAVYAAFVQLRWSFAKWRNEAGSFEKGFYGWLCDKLNLEECSPYTVIELFSSTEVETRSGQRSRQNPEDARVAVVYSEQSGSRRSQGSRRSEMSSLPSASRQTRMQRVESAM